MQTQTIQISIEKLKKKFLELLKRLEEDKIRTIGQFIEEEVKPYMSIEEFAKLIDTEGYGVTRLQEYNKVYRKLYKDETQQCRVLTDLDKATIISKVDDKEVQEEFIERSKEVPREQLREEVNNYLDTGQVPTEETKSQIEMNLKYNGAVLKLISEMRQLRSALYQVRREKLFDSFTPHQRKKFKTYLTTIKEEYKSLISEIDKNSKYLEA